MNVKDLYIKQIKQISENDHQINIFELNTFIQKNRQPILDLLNDKKVFNKTLNLVNSLINDKRYYLQVIYLELFSSKLSQNYELKYRLGIAFFEIKQFKQAVFHLDKIPIENRSIDHLRLYLNIYYQSQDFKKSIEMVNKIRARHKIDAVNTVILIDSYRRLKKISDAENELINLDKANVDQYRKFHIKIQIKLAKNMFDKSLENLENSYGKYKDKVEFLELYSIVLRKVGRIKDALFQLNLAKNLGYKEYDSLSYPLYLSQKSYNEGFYHLSKATEIFGVENYFKSKNIPKWKGENLESKILIIYSGDGVELGDQIFFFRYILWAKEKFKNIELFFFNNNLKFKYLFDKNGITIDQINNLPDYSFDKSTLAYHHTLSALAGMYCKSESNGIVNHVKYLPTSARKEEFWINHLYNYGEKKKVGLNWKGDIKYKLDIYRSIDLEMLDPFFQIDNFYFSLNPNLSESELVLNERYKNFIIFSEKEFIDEKKDTFIDTIEIMKKLDLIVTTDTSIAHLSTALGLKTILMLEYAPFWYWNTAEKDNYYQNENLKIFKQASPGDWGSVIDCVRDYLIEFKKS